MTNLPYIQQSKQSYPANFYYKTTSSLEGPRLKTWAVFQIQIFLLLIPITRMKMLHLSKKETLYKQQDHLWTLNGWLSSNRSWQTRIIWYSTDNKIHRQNIILLCGPFRTKLVQITRFFRLIHSSTHPESSRSEQYFNSWDYRAA